MVTPPESPEHVTPPESPEHVWDPLPLPQGYLPDPIDLDGIDGQTEIEDEMIDEGEPVGLPAGFDDEPPRSCDVLQAYYQKGGSSGSTAKGTNPSLEGLLSPRLRLSLNLNLIRDSTFVGTLI